MLGEQLKCPSAEPVAREDRTSTDRQAKKSSVFESSLDRIEKFENRGGFDSCRKEKW